MTTEEFLSKAKELGLSFRFNEELISIYDNHKIFGIVGFENYGVLNTNWRSMKQENNSEKKKELLELLYEYVTTPVKERGDHRKYKLKTPIASNYLYTTVDGELFLSEKELENCRNVFVQPEIDNLPNQDFIKTLIKEEVECQI